LFTSLAPLVTIKFTNGKRTNLPYHVPQQGRAAKPAPLQDFEKKK
jgi:hypothetical protein